MASAQKIFLKAKTSSSPRLQKTSARRFFDLLFFFLLDNFKFI